MPLFETAPRQFFIFSYERLDCGKLFIWIINHLRKKHYKPCVKQERWSKEWQNKKVMLASAVYDMRNEETVQARNLIKSLMSIII